MCVIYSINEFLQNGKEKMTHVENKNRFETFVQIFQQKKNK